MKKKGNVCEEEKLIIGMISVYRKRMNKSTTTAKMLYCREQMDYWKEKLGRFRKVREPGNYSKITGNNWPPMVDTINHCSTCKEFLEGTSNCLGCPAA